MSPTVNTLIVGVLFLCGLKELVFSHHGHCAENHCFALFWKPKNFEGAQKSCKESGGRLFTFPSTDLLTILPSGLNGSFWLELHNTGTANEEAERRYCSSISISSGRNITVSWELCSEDLNGFLCQYTFEEHCWVYQPGLGAQVYYTSSFGFEVKDSEAFPPGTFAVTQKAGSKYPDTKHVCFSKNWRQAPWTCEVLQGGCEHSCKSSQTCTCPEGQILHPNKITCIPDSAQECQPGGNTSGCKCRKGFKLALDRKSCVYVDECAEDNPCTGDGEECVGTLGYSKCTCKDGFIEEDGACVDVRICNRCEHMLCDKISGIYECICRNGYRVTAADPTKCEMYCTERDCPASCIRNPDNTRKNMPQCFCPDGYILDLKNGTPICTDINECESEKQCDHKCENLLGSFICSCNHGFKLHKKYMCVATENVKKEVGSGSTPLYPTMAGIHPEAVPSYIKTGSILGITIFLLLGILLLFFLVQNAVKRFSRFELPRIKHSNIDIFYLQQVSTETYKRLPFDKP